MKFDLALICASFTGFFICKGLLIFFFGSYTLNQNLFHDIFSTKLFS